MFSTSAAAAGAGASAASGGTLSAAARGFEVARAEQQELGDKVRAMLERNGFKSVAAEGYKAPSVVVNYTDAADIQNGSRFAAER